MKALVIVAHGSSREASNQEVIALAVRMKESLASEYPLVNAGFLELAEPLIPASIEQCIEQGATDISVLPYFLSAGRHVQEDVPNEVQSVINKFPKVKITILSHIGGLPQMDNLIREAVQV